MHILQQGIWHLIHANVWDVSNFCQAISHYFGLLVKAVITGCLPNLEDGFSSQFPDKYPLFDDIFQCMSHPIVEKL